MLVDGREIARVTLGPGDFTLIEPVQPGAGRRCVWLHFSNGQVLADEPFPRRVTALARFIGFEADVGDGQRPHVCQAAREPVEEPDALPGMNTGDEKPTIASASFPADLGNAALEYEGIYQDGWLMGAASICLDQAAASSVLVVRMLIPLIDDPGFTTELCLLVDGTEIRRQAFGIGELELRVTVPLVAGLRRVEVRFSSTQWLPEAVPRRVTALAQFVGFED